MGARSFMLATRIPMSRGGFDEWLRTPLPGLNIIENPSAMYAGWASDGTDPDWGLTEIAAHYPSALAGIRADRDRTPLQLLAPRAAQGLTLLRHRDEALEAYLYDYHGEQTGAQTCLLMLAGAGRFAHPGTETPVMYWGGDVYPGLPMPGDQPLAVLLVANTRSRFVHTCALDALIGNLTPSEADFLTATTYGQDEAPAHPSSNLLDPAFHAHPGAAPTEHRSQPPLPMADH